MCIICNLTSDAVSADRAVGVWSSFSAAQDAANAAMRKAEAAMLEAVAMAPSREIATQYSAHHKRLVRARKDWNRLDEKREQAA